MEYKGHIAAIEYDDSVGFCNRSVINSGNYPVANCEAPDVDMLNEDLRISIDEYLAMCEENGVEPHCLFFTSLNLNLETELCRRVSITAARNRQTIDDWITDLLEREAEVS